MKVLSLQLKRQEAESREDQNSVRGHSGEPAEIGKDSPDDSSFERRLEELRSVIRRPRRRSGSGEGTNIVSAHIRHASWIATAIVFLAVLFMRWNGQMAELPGSIFIAAFIAAAVLCLAELIVLLVRRL